MDLDEFLSENGIPTADGRSPPSSKGMTPPRSVASADGSSGSGLIRGSLAHNNNDSSDSSKPGSSASTRYPDSPINYQR